MNVIKIDDYRWEIPRTGDMRVNGRIYANENLFRLLAKDKALEQVRNVATLPGIIGFSYGMPDIHEGYGFPIGGVAAMDINTGVISPGGVGYDINCGVRLIKTHLHYNSNASAREKSSNVIDSALIKKLTDNLNATIPTGVGSEGAIKKLSNSDLNKILTNGSRWAVENGYGNDIHLHFTEEEGTMSGADPNQVSETAKKRGLNQLGTLGSGNHFIELGFVNKIFDEEAANILGLKEGQITLMIHCGSRGLGHQVCDDFIKYMKDAEQNTGGYSFKIPDRQLISVPINSAIGEDYYGAMVAAANFAWANRQVIMALAEETILKSLSISRRELGFSLIYDVCHNIAKMEEHIYDDKRMKLCVHRKGATRAFAPHHPSIPLEYRKIGQPVIIPGDMGRHSYLCLGTEQAMRETFGSSCHGAGRIMSRKEAIRSSKPNEVLDDMKKKGIYVQSADKLTLSEEKSSAYKNVSDVVETMSECRLLKKVALLKPLGVIKG